MRDRESEGINNAPENTNENGTDGYVTPYALFRRMRTKFWPAWISRDIGFLLVARGSMSAVRALASIVVPIYLALLGFNALLLGVLFTATALVSAAMSAMIGMLSDRLGRKPFIVIIPLITAVASVIFAFSTTAGVLFVFAALGSFGRGSGAGAGTIGPYQPAEQAILAEKVPSRHRNSLFGRVAFASSLGALIGTGPLLEISQWLSRPGSLTSYHVDFIVQGAFALLAGLLAIPITEVRRPRSAPRPASTPAASGRGWRWPITRESWSILLRLLVTNSINGLAVGFFGPFITYWFYRRYGVGPAQIGILYSFINLAAMVANLSAAPLAARLGLVRAILVSRMAQAVLLVPMVLAPSFWLAGGVYLVRMMVQRLGLPLRQSYVMGVVPAEERGSVGALSNLPSQATSSLSPTFAGYLFDHVSISMPFEIGALFQAVNALLFFLFFRNLRPPEEIRQPTRERLEEGSLNGQLPEAPRATSPHAASQSDLAQSHETGSD